MSKILCLFNGYSGTGATSGGSIHALEVINALDFSKHEVTTLLTKAAAEGNLEKELASTVQRQYYWAWPHETKLYRHLPIVMLIFIYRILITPIFFKKNNIIFATSHLFYDVWPLQWCGNRRTVVVVHHLIDQQSRAGWYGHLTKWLERKSLQILKKKKSKIITVSNRVTTQLVDQYGFDADLILTSSNGLHLPAPTKATKRYQLAFCGRLLKNKGINDFVEIVDYLKKHGRPKIQAIMIGEGVDKENLQDKIDQLQLQDNIKLAGFVSDEEKDQLIRQSELFLMTSHEEGWSLVIGEALALGTPVIAYDLPDIVDIWQQSVTWVRAGEIKSFALLVDQLLEQPAKLDKLAKQGREFVRRYDWGQIIPKEIEWLTTP